jgi:hypothetical protein
VFSSTTPNSISDGTFFDNQEIQEYWKNENLPQETVTNKLEEEEEEEEGGEGGEGGLKEKSSAITAKKR